jgi:hypothetical protein
MTRRKGDITRRQLDRQRPCHIAVLADKIRGFVSSETVRGFAPRSTGSPLTQGNDSAEWQIESRLREPRPSAPSSLEFFYIKHFT